MAAQWTPIHLRIWPCGTASQGCGSSHREYADQNDQPRALRECAASAANLPEKHVRLGHVES